MTKRDWTRGEWFGLVALLVAAAVWPVLQARTQSLWGDEVFSLAVATGHSLEHAPELAEAARGDFVEAPQIRPAGHWAAYAEFDTPTADWGRIVRAVELSDIHPPVYYLALNLWLRLWGTSDLALRMFSILAALACLPFVVAIGRRLGGPMAGWVAGALFASAPMFVHYAVEGRMYSLIWLTVVAGAWLTLRLWEGAVAWPWQVAWVLLGALGLLVHYFFLFPWAAMAALLWWRPGADRRWHLVGRAAAIGVLILPWYLKVPEILGRWRVTIDWQAFRPEGFTWAAALRDSVLQFYSGRGLWAWPMSPKAEWLALAGIALVAAGAWIRRRQWRGATPSWPWLLAGIWWLGAWAGPIVFDVMRGTYTLLYPRYMGAALPAACLLAAGLIAASPRAIRWAGVLMLLVAWHRTTLRMYQSHERGGSPLQQIARDLDARVAGDSEAFVLVHSIPAGVVGVSRYLRPETPVAAWVGQLGQRTVPESIRQLVEGRSRVVMIRIHEVYEPAPQEAWLRERAEVISEHSIGGGHILDFRLRDSTSLLAAAPRGPARGEAEWRGEE